MSSYAYDYYLDGNQASKTDHTDKKTTYLYDGLGRLTKETESVGNVEKWSKAYAYDKASNRKTMIVTGDESYQHHMNTTKTIFTALSVSRPCGSTITSELERGWFQWPRHEAEARQITQQQLRWLLEGLSLDQPKAVQKIASVKVV